jgi:DNA mismatch repair protein MutL
MRPTYGIRRTGSSNCKGMNKIKVLPDTLANQIAAGEVVERPASVIKELIENSIDAGAGRIAIEIELGGRRLMRIADDGEGMVRDDAILAFERHATSKIRDLDDLGRIGTLGFRGEALASIASVAKVELVTKVEQEAAATRVLIEGGRLVDVKDAPRATGTTIAVRDLFFNTPARRKFMRSEATENYHLTGIVQHYALAHPEIAFTLTNNGREVINVSPAKDLRERAYQIFGTGIIESLLPVSGGHEMIARVTGFVSAPRERRTNRDSQYFFVNQRFVRDKTIAGGLAEGYRAVLPHGVYPVAFLFIETPLEEVDVNVHPAKTEVRFRRKEAVKEAIAEAVRDSLARAGMVPVESKPAVQPDPKTFTGERGEAPVCHEQVTEAREIVEPEGSSDRITLSAAAGTAHELVTVPVQPLFVEELGERIEDVSSVFEQAAAERSSDLPEPGYQLGAEPMLPPVDSAARLIKSSEPEQLNRSRIETIAQLHESFIIATDDEGLLLIDQHVAHERILFDKFRRSESDRPIESQNLLLPETLDLSPAQAEAFALVENELERLGFGLMRLSGRTVAIRSIPTDVAPALARNLFAEILDNIEPTKRGNAKSTLRDDVAASLACKAAIKINMKLTPEKMRWLVDRLLMTSSPTTCPHGRPVILRLAMKDIERGFHRT